MRNNKVLIVDDEIDDELFFQANMGGRDYSKDHSIFYVNNCFVPGFLKEKGSLELKCDSCGNEFMIDYDLFKRITGHSVSYLGD